MKVLTSYGMLICISMVCWSWWEIDVSQLLPKAHYTKSLILWNTSNGRTTLILLQFFYLSKPVQHLDEGIPQEYSTQISQKCMLTKLDLNVKWQNEKYDNQLQIK